ncbi:MULTISPECIES: RNA 2'-phosphotransferase [unclassified Pseudomonas]|uniref:RNA 2'-phosphotransferase n=1 Tax=unclassified Pseudomonas TaxID=196821 RepID=UPI00244C80B4|nr:MULTISPECIES: RNA 2'-phosphotransferase [unclassified Pseudomonas]MDG9927846.1 RNA 2'-phosphotransferase [Pseudomonas sp. GD04042]MDH0483055.1 RNA 2'-phosphotransferase [Pseudomonas sp. GD04015]MDH0605248.1 RNA 2'-phosphotransferase [Pseudomonas sp. GD03869]
MTTKRLNETSKFLSYILRHEPHAIGLQLDSEGWADIESLIAGAAKDGRTLDIALIQAVVSSSDKKRFSISDDGLRIRAVQGHSTTNVSIQHVEKEPPEFLYHGTATRFLESIRQQGLIAGSRHHVHLSQDIPTAIAVGQRYGKPVVLIIEALLMHQQGFKFFHAENGVWLTNNVPAAFVKKDQLINCSPDKITSSANT